MHRALRCLLPAIAILAGTASCGDEVTAPHLRPTASIAPVSASALPLIIFLPPLGDGPLPSPRPAGRGAADAPARVEVDLCVRSDSACIGAPIARFRTDGTGAQRLAHAGAGPTTYAAEWRVPAVTAAGARRYRVTVLVDGRAIAQRDLLALDLIRDLLRGLPPHQANEHLVLGGLPLPIVFWIEPAPHRLLVQVGDGVTGGPPAADSLMPNGTTVRYAFGAAPGYQNVLVRLDGHAAPTSGIVLADADHTLTATADRHVTIPAAAAALYQRARDVLRAADPAAAFQDYLDRVTEFVGAHDAPSALRQIQDLEYLAFDPIRDSAALRRLDAALAGHELAITGDTNAVSPVDGARRPTGAAGQRTPLRSLALAARPTVPDSLERTMFLFVNGIWTPQFGPSGAAAAYTTLRILVSAVPLFRNPTAFAVHYFYNRTHSEQRPTPDQQRAHCTAAFTTRLLLGYQGLNAFAPFLADCMADPTYRRFSDHDLLECIRQMIAIIGNTAGAEIDAVRLGERIQQHRTNGRHVILVPHSQGNLMTNQAIHRLRGLTGEYDPARDSTCIGVVSLASPTSRRWDDLSPHYLVPIVVRGDAVPAIDNDWPAIDTDLSHKLLDTPSLANLLKPTGIILHDAIDSYMEQPQSRAAIQAGLQSVYGACAARTASVAPTSTSVTMGHGTVLSALALNAFGDTLGGRTFVWSNGDPLVTALAQTDGLHAAVQGVGTGTSVIAVGSHAAHAEATVTVTPSAPTADPFSFTYLAPYAEGFLGDDPHLSGTIAHPGAVPLPAGALSLSFFREYGQLTAAANGIAYAVSTIYPDTVVLFAPNSVRVNTYRLVWNADRTTLTGTFDTEIWRFHQGSVPVTLPVAFERQTP